MTTNKEEPICDIRVLRSMPRHQDAKKLLEEIASRVQPIMIKYKWKLGLLSEFWPEQASLMGLNVVYGRTIKLRLRKADKEDEFIPINDIIDTMLHQLCHNSYDSSRHLAFNNLLDRLRKGYDVMGGSSSHKESGCCCMIEKERLEDGYKACEIRALRNMPRHEDAQKLLEEIASLVQPIMIKHMWRTELLSEFWPEQASVMGLNIKRGLHIKLRLRRAEKQDEFIATHDILDTMLHQLSHNLHHDSTNVYFNIVLHNLRKEFRERRLEDLSSQHPLPYLSKEITNDSTGKGLEDLSSEHSPLSFDNKTEQKNEIVGRGLEDPSSEHPPLSLSKEKEQEKTIEEMEKKS